MKKLRTILQFDDVSGLLIYSSIALILLFISFLYPIVLIILIVYLIYIFKENKMLFIYTLCILLLLSIVYIVYLYVFLHIKQSGYIEGIIVDKNDDFLLVKEKWYYVKLYINDNSDIKLGDKIKANYSIYQSSERNVEGVFSYSRYKYSKRIAFEAITNKVDSIETPFNIYRIKGLIIEYIDTSYPEESSMYIKELVLGVSEMPEEFTEKINQLGIIYLFCISGLHISILKNGIKKLFNLINMPEEITSVIVISILIFYATIVTSSVSISRSIIMNVITEGLVIFNKKISKYDILSITLVINLLINPLQIYTLGFFLTYLSTLAIYLIKGKKNIFKIGFTITIINIPLLLYFNHKISLCLLLHSILFNAIFSYFFIPFTYIALLLKPLSFVYNYAASLITKLISISSIVNYEITFSIYHPFFLIIVYLLLVFIFKYKYKHKHKPIFLLLGVLVLNFGFSRCTFFPKVIVIDVDQGDSILLRSGFKNILIDTGVSDDYDTTINYLQKMNVYSIDAIFISHDDSDHCGEEPDIISNFNVKNIYRNLNNQSTKIGAFNIKTYRLENAATLNEGSMVLDVNVFGERYLFTGDIEEEGERYLLTRITGEIDYLKVAHHGSDTSTSSEFLSQTKPKIALISVGEKNTYGHPSEDVINRLKKSNATIYRTDQDGTISISHYYIFTLIKTFKASRVYPFTRIRNIKLIFDSFML